MPFKASHPLCGLVLAILLALHSDYGGRGVRADEPSEKKPAPAKFWKKEDYPNPREDPDECNRDGKISWVCDPDSVMTEKEADDLDDLLEEVRLNTSCACEGECDFPNSGFHIAIALMKKQHTTNVHLTEMDKLKETETFARFLQESGWDYGHCDDDAVIVVSIDYRKVWTSMGNRFKEKVSDWCVQHVYKEVRHTIWAGNVSQGLYDMIDTYGMVLSGRTECEVGIRAGSIIFILAMVSFGLCAVISFISFFRQRFKGCGNSPERV